MSDFCNRFRSWCGPASIGLAAVVALVALVAGSDALLAQIRVQADPLIVATPVVDQQEDQQHEGEPVPSRPAKFRATWEMMFESRAEATAAESIRRRVRAPRPAFNRGFQTGMASLEQLQAGNDELGASAPATVSQSFVAGTLGELGSLPPDPSASAGPTQFIFAANGRIRTFARGTLGPDGVMNLTLNAFFTPVRNGASTFTPKVKYDRLAGRWFIIAATDALPGRIVIASSNSATISGSTIWSFFAFDNSFTGTGCAIDSPTLGIDPYALYIGVIQFCSNGTVYSGTSGFVVRKTSVIDSATPVVTAFNNLTGTPTGAGPYAPQGVDVEDYSGVGYFIGVDNSALGSLVLRRISNPATTPTISGNVTLAVAATAQPIKVRHMGNSGGANGYLDGGDDRLTNASVTNGRLWTSHAIGVVDNGQASASATRNAVRWYEIGSLTTSTAVMQSGTLFTGGSPGSADTRNYFVPTIATSIRGRSIVGFTAAGTSEFANAGLAERFSADAPGTLRAAQLFTAANAAYNPPGDPGSTRGRRWGGGSATFLDGCDGTTLWTVQQFTNSANSYGVAVARTVGAAPATPVSVSPATVASGVASIDLQVTATSSGGSAFFDNDASYLCRITASIPGVTVNSVTLTSPTTVTINVSTVNAMPGLKAITVINPDSQAASTGQIFRVTPGPLVTIEKPAAGTMGQPVTVSGWAVDGNAASGTGVDAVHVYAYNAANSPTFLGAATYGISRPDIGAALGSRFTASGYSITSPTILPPGQYTLVAFGHSTATGTFNATASVVVTLTALAAPFGTVDTPANNVTVSGEVAVTGWALDDAEVAAVDIFRSPVAGEGGGQIFLGRAVFIRGARPDVQAAYPAVPNNDNAGWGFMVLTNMLPNQGNGVFDLFVYAADRAGLSTLLGTRRITAANSASTKPFGTIDTPLQGETVSGTIVNFGWALTPMPAAIPTDGSTIDVYIDGVYRGHAVYNNFRPDIAAIFPGLNNSQGAIGYYVIDTTTLANGLHTIQWVVRDNAGQTSGIGSRFFRVQN
jgi:hypothetical protein